MNIGVPELVIVLVVIGMIILPLAILVLVIRNTRRPPIPGPPPIDPEHEHD